MFGSTLACYCEGVINWDWQENTLYWGGVFGEHVSVRATMFGSTLACYCEGVINWDWQENTIYWGGVFGEHVSVLRCLGAH